MEHFLEENVPLRHLLKETLFDGEEGHKLLGPTPMSSE